jgi:hypothetical protein
MSDYRITPEQVRQRLLTMLEVEVTDPTLNSLAYIPASEAWIDIILDDNSLTYAGLNSSKQTMAKVAQVARCAWIVLSSAPKENYKAALIEFKGTNANNLQTSLDAFESEWTESLARCGAAVVVPGGSSTGGDDYQNDGQDLTNIHYSDTSGGPLSRFS